MSCTFTIDQLVLLLREGALPAVDWLSAAAIAELDKVVIEQIKPPKAWLGTPAEEVNRHIFFLHIHSLAPTQNLHSFSTCTHTTITDHRR